MRAVAETVFLLWDSHCGSFRGFKLLKILLMELKGLILWEDL